MTTAELVAAMEEIALQRNWALGRCADYAHQLAKARASADAKDQAIAEKDAAIAALEADLQSSKESRCRTRR